MRLPFIELKQNEIIQLRMVIAMMCWESVCKMESMKVSDQGEKMITLFAGDKSNPNAVSHVDLFVKALYPYDSAFVKDLICDESESRYYLKGNLTMREERVYCGHSINKDVLLRRTKKSTAVVTGRSLHKYAQEAICECRKALKHAKDHLNSDGEFLSGRNEDDLLLYVRTKMYEEHLRSIKQKGRKVTNVENEDDDTASTASNDDGDDGMPNDWCFKGYTAFCLWVCPKVKVIPDDLVCLTITCDAKVGDTRKVQRAKAASDKKVERDGALVLKGPRGMDLDSSIKIGAIAEKSLQRHDSHIRDNFAMLSSKLKLAENRAKRMSSAKNPEEMKHCQYWKTVSEYEAKLLDDEDTQDETVDAAKAIVSSLMVQTAPDVAKKRIKTTHLSSPVSSMSSSPSSHVTMTETSNNNTEEDDK